MRKGTATLHLHMLIHLNDIDIHNEQLVKLIENMPECKLSLEAEILLSSLLKEMFLLHAVRFFFSSHKMDSGFRKPGESTNSKHCR